MRGPHLVGIDLGSQSAKVEVLDMAGAVVAAGRRELRPTVHPVPGAVEHPDDDLWDALGAACREALTAYAAAGHDLADLAAIGLCGIRNCRVVVADDGTLAHPAMSWMDRRVGRAHRPMPGQRWVTASSGYLTIRLTGEARDSVAAYRGLWPIDLADRRWSSDPSLLAECGTPPEVLVDLVEPGEVLGRVTAYAARHTGLPAGLPVVASANDKAVEALGCGLDDPSDVVISLGTYAAAMTVGDGPSEDLTSSWTNFAARPDRYLFESVGVRRAMWTVSWVRELTARETSVADLDAAAAGVPPGANGLLAVPDWLAPLDEPHRRGALVGFDERHGAAHLHRAVVEGLALVLADNAEAMLAELGRPPGRLLLAGGGSGSAVARQAFAAALNRPLVTFPTGSRAALGAAMCAAVGAGVHETFDDALAAMVPAGTVVTADDAECDTYARLRELHRDLRASLDPVLRRAHGGGSPTLDTED